MKLLNCDIIMIHEEVQQVNCKVSGCGAQFEAIAHHCDEVCKVPPQAKLWRLAFVDWQLELLRQRSNKSTCSAQKLDMQYDFSHHKI